MSSLMSFTFTDIVLGRVPVLHSLAGLIDRLIDLLTDVPHLLDGEFLSIYV